MTVAKKKKMKTNENRESTSEMSMIEYKEMPLTKKSSYQNFNAENQYSSEGFFFIFM
jgi:hypothetical protein